MNLKKYLYPLLVLFSISGYAQNDQSLSGSTAAQSDEGEAHIAIDPTDSTKMIMGFMELGAGLSFEIYHSQDAGDNWQLSTFDALAAMQPDMGSYTVIGGGDVVFAYAVNGDIYCSWISLWANFGSGNPLDSCLWRATWAKSTDGGVSFSMQNDSTKNFAYGSVDLNGGLNVLDVADGIADRQWMAVDRTNGPFRDNLYVGYINYPFDLQQTGLKVKVKTPGSNSFSAETVAYQGSGQLTNIATDANGIVHYTFVDLALNTINHVSSSDGGQSFSNTHLIANGQNVFPQGNFKINDRENSAPSLAIDGANNLHLVWGEFPAGDTLPASYYSKSTDGGLNWSNPIELSSIFNDKVFMPVVSAYENRISISGNVLSNDKKSEYYLALSDDNGANFSWPVKLSSGITDFVSTGLQSFVGDYSSSVRTYCTIYSLWTDCRANGCKQYIGKYDQCANVGLVELTPIESNFSMDDIYPNPVIDKLHISIQSKINGSLKLEVMDASARILKTQDYDLVEGENNLSLDVIGLKAGNYFVKTSNSEGTFFTRTFVKD